jgi:hypothetical protein
MTFIYRFQVDGTGVTFDAPGQLQKVDGALVVVAQTSYEHALLLSQHASAQTPAVIWAIVDGQAVAFMRASKVRAKERRGQFVELWAIVQTSSVFADARRKHFDKVLEKPWDKQ